MCPWVNERRRRVVEEGRGDDARCVGRGRAEVRAERGVLRVRGGLELEERDERGDRGGEHAGARVLGHERVRRLRRGERGEVRGVRREEGVEGRAGGVPNRSANSSLQGTP